MTDRDDTGTGPDLEKKVRTGPGLDKVGGARPTRGTQARTGATEYAPDQAGAGSDIDPDADVPAPTPHEAMTEAEKAATREEHVRLSEGALLRADELVAGYLPGVNILRGCNFYLREGELVGIIGPNGAGKSTLLKSMFGLIPVRSGSVTLRDKDITSAAAHDLVIAGVGYVPQNNNVFPSLTIEENMQMGCFRRSKVFAERFAYVSELFPMLGQRRRQKVNALSGGERQMVAMGRALMMEPSVLLLDEPSAGLSPAYQDEVFIRCRRINATGVSIIMVEQNARRCLQICNRGYVLDQGRNAYTDKGRSLMNDAKVIELYLGTLATTR